MNNEKDEFIAFLNRFDKTFSKLSVNVETKGTNINKEESDNFSYFLKETIIMYLLVHYIKNNEKIYVSSREGVAIIFDALKEMNINHKLLQSFDSIAKPKVRQLITNVLTSNADNGNGLLNREEVTNIGIGSEKKYTLSDKFINDYKENSSIFMRRNFVFYKYPLFHNFMMLVQEKFLQLNGCEFCSQFTGLDDHLILTLNERISDIDDMYIQVCSKCYNKKVMEELQKNIQFISKEVKK
jgi:hypothetical protein